jgi:hypothetical protein
MAIIKKPEKPNEKKKLGIKGFPHQFWYMLLLLLATIKLISLKKFGILTVSAQKDS